MAEPSEKQAKVGVSVLISKGDRILLEKRQHTHGAGTWGPPSGHIDYGETPEQTAIRETKEETGVTISNPKFRVVTNDVFEKEQKHYITVWFEAEYVSGEPKVSAPRPPREGSHGGAGAARVRSTRATSGSGLRVRRSNSRCSSRPRLRIFSSRTAPAIRRNWQHRILHTIS